MKGKIITGHLSKGRPEDAGQDIHCDSMVCIPANGSKAVTTNLRVAVPFGHVGLVWPRSGSSFKNHIETGAGVIDHEYRGEIKVKLYNFGDNEVCFEPDERVAQLLTIPVNSIPYDMATDDEAKALMECTNRGEDGFGSSGK